jgi:hypothetical protein
MVVCHARASARLRAWHAAGAFKRGWQETVEKMTNGYLSDGLMGRAQESKKGELINMEISRPVRYFT